jgi:ABC-type nitrate/sulfonate/bicarbonate transport system substrate-binding protein
MFMRVMASDAKLDLEKDMAWIGVGGPPTGLPALKAKQIDAYLTLDPAPAVAAVGGYGQVIVDLSKGEGPSNFKGIFYNGYVTLRKTAESNPAMTEAFVRALAKSFCWIKDEKNFKDMVALTKTKVPVGELKDAQIEEMVRANLPGLALRIPAEHFKTWNGMLMRAKILKNELDPAKILGKSVPKEEPKC